MAWRGTGVNGGVLVGHCVSCGLPVEVHVSVKVSPCCDARIVTHTTQNSVVQAGRRR